MGIVTSQNSVIVVTLANSEGSEFKRGHIPIGANLRQNSFRVARHPGGMLPPDSFHLAAVR
jgi:hypothetical protein